MNRISKLILATSALVTASFATADTINVPCSSGSGFAPCKNMAEEWADKTGHSVNIVTVPISSTEKLALYQQILAAGGTDLDVFDMDVIWPGILGSHFIDLKPYTKGAEKNHFQSIIDNNTYRGKLVAMPMYTDAGLLYYRKDLLEKYGEKPPTTWHEMTRIATRIQNAERSAGNEDMWGFVFQGKAYEGLTCDALEWVDSFSGGSIIDADGKITINNDKAAAALDLAASWVGKIAPPGVLNYAEEEARGVFQVGNAVFMRNWPYAWALGNADDSAIKGKIGTAPLPKGPNGKHTGTLGGWQIGVSKYSKSPEAAASYVMYVSSADLQKRGAIQDSRLPTIKTLYQDPDVLAANPFFGQMYDTFVNSVARPSRVAGEKYNRVSTEFWNATYNVLAGKANGATALARLESKLKRIRRRGW